MTMTAKESKAVAWLYRYPHDGESEYCLSPVPCLDSWVAHKGASVTPLVEESALNAAEADNKETERDRRRWAIRAEAAETELGELRRRVSELASDLVVLAKHHEIRADRPYQDEGTTNWHSGYDEGITECADRLRQLLASDGGADGDDEGEGK